MGVVVTGGPSPLLRCRLRPGHWHHWVVVVVGELRGWLLFKKEYLVVENPPPPPPPLVAAVMVLKVRVGEESFRVGNAAPGLCEETIGVTKGGIRREVGMFGNWGNSCDSCLSFNMTLAHAPFASI